jgi:hypothetical protein
MLFISSAAIVSALTLGVSCSKQPREFAKSPFHSDPAHLGTPCAIEQLELEIAPPKGWSRLDSSETVQFQKLLAATELKRKFRETAVLDVFLDLNTSCMLYIAEFERDTLPITTVARQYYEFLKARTGIQELNDGAYLIQDQPVYYFRVHSMTTINYKLLGETESGQRFLIEYVAGSEVHNRVKDAIESSMASLKRL